MSKTWETKHRILQLLSGKSKTLSILSSELDLAPSTVSEHIEELENVGAVRRVDNPFIKKWKYYERNPDFDSASLKERRRSPNNTMKIAAGLAVIVGLIAIFMLDMPAIGGTSSAASTVGFLLTDPPHVPAGTQALNIEYSSLQVHIIDTGNASASGWVNGTGSGSLDLMQLLNVTQDIGSAKIPANAEINAVRFQITNASIVVNGTAYNAIVPNGNLTTSIAGTVSANTSILLDLSPVVVSIFTNNTAAFVLVPSVKAVFIGNQSAQQTGAKMRLNENESERLHAASGISITNATLSVAGNNTVLSVTVKNDANKSVDIHHVTLFGVGVSAKAIMGASVNISGNTNDIPAIMESASNGANSPLGTAASIAASISAYGSGNTGAGNQDVNSQDAGNFGAGASNTGETNSSASTNGFDAGAYANQDTHGFDRTVVSLPWVSASVRGTGNASANTGILGGMPLLVNSAGQRNMGEDHAFVPFFANVNGTFRVSGPVIGTMFGTLDFLVEANGTLVLPLIGACGQCALGTICPNTACVAKADGVSNSGRVDALYSNGGYSLAAGASATFTFSGQITYADGHLLVLPANGSEWKLVVTGQNGAEVETNVTAA